MPLQNLLKSAFSYIAMYTSMEDSRMSQKQDLFQFVFISQEQIRVKNKKQIICIVLDYANLVRNITHESKDIDLYLVKCIKSDVTIKNI